MRSSFARRVITFLLAQSLYCSTLFAQQETRPRRAQSAQGSQGDWTAPAPTQPAIPNPTIVQISGKEPSIRVALTTDARAAVISTSSHLMKATGSDSTLLALDTSRIRVEPRLLSPIPPAAADDVYRVLVAGTTSKEEADDEAKEIKKLTGEETQAVLDSETKTWSVAVGPKRPREEAEELRARLDAAGLEASISGPPPAPVIAASTNASTQRSNVRLTSKPAGPSREVVASSTTNASLFSSSAPVAFASDDEKNAPVRYNDKAYRGRIEVFTNLRGNLTVVNELGLEDYVRGVVANELSPGGYPALEALKAQAIAARTYALKNMGQFMSQGFDILPTTRSQVYRGLTSEHPLSSRAVDETRGLIATYGGEPINALYTSTCGGRTENSENIFNQAVPYLRGRDCAAEGALALSTFNIKTSREPADLKEDSNVPLARDVSLLLLQNFGTLQSRVSDSWLANDASVSEVRNWLANVARIAKQIAPTVTEDVNRPPAFATALASAVFGESRTSTLLNEADADYLLATSDAQDVPEINRADLAMLIRDGHYSPYPDGTLKPRHAITRGRALHAIARVLENRNLLQLQKATARPTVDGQLVLRSTKGKDMPLRVSDEAFLFRQIGERMYGVRTVVLVGGEPVLYHVGPDGQVDYLEVRPAQNGAAADRSSPFANWSRMMSLGQVQSRLARAARGIGPITDLQVVSRGYSHRVTDLEIIGVNGTAHVKGGRIRSALGLPEQLFVIDRDYDDNGRVTELVFTGRGWGHGVGMCQVGAYGLAKQGWSFDRILKAYYSNIDLTKMYQ